MIGRHGHRKGSSNAESDGDDGHGNNNNSTNEYASNTTIGGKRVDQSSNVSDRDALRDIFTNPTSSCSAPLSSNQNAITSCCAAKLNHIHSKEKRTAYNGGNNGGGIIAGNISEMTGPLHLHADESNTEQTNYGDDSWENGRGDERTFTSCLGQRIWREHQDHQQRQSQEHDKKLHGVQSNPLNHYSQHPPQKLRHDTASRKELIHDQGTTPSLVLRQELPPPGFLRLPPTISPRKQPSSFNKIDGITAKELERKVIQQHLDMEASEEPTKSSPLMEDEQQQITVHDCSSICNISSTLLTSECFTRTIERDAKVGLGMSLREYDGCVYIQALLQQDGSRLEENRPNKEKDCNTTAGPAFRSGLLPGDRLLGLNGLSFLKGRLVDHDGSSNLSQTRLSSEEVLKSVGDALSNAESPMVLHIHRIADRELVLSMLRKAQTAFKDKKVSVTESLSSVSKTKAKQHTFTKSKGPVIHPFAVCLADRNLIQKNKEEIAVTQQMRIFTDRSRQWESKLSFRLRASDYTLRPLLDARDVEPSYYASFFTDDGECPQFFSYKFSKSIRSYAPSTPMIQDWRLSHPGECIASPARHVNQKVSKEAVIMADLYAGLDDSYACVQDLSMGSKICSTATENRVDYPSSVMQALPDPTDIFVPLVGIRKAICVRILNSFLDNMNRTAFTVWCYDVESGMEWYAPARYYNDFRDLRSALVRVDKAINEIPFPSLGWSLGFSSSAKESAKAKEGRRTQLETFLRRAFAGVYRGRLHPHLAEAGVHLQTFVGCDTVLGKGCDGSSLSLSKQVAISESSYGKRTSDHKSSNPDSIAQMHLKRSIMRYVYRLFLLPSLEELVSRFVDAARVKVMAESMGPSTRQTHQFAVDKGEAKKNVQRIRDFIDQVQDLIVDGCRDDFISISQRRDFAAIHIEDDSLDDLFREAVREQTEIEVYVPLRSTISKYLVYAWFNEDMEMKHKMKALAEKPQSYFRVPKEYRSRSDWKSVSRILKEGVQRSTLPCVKLRAVVDAAKEISQLDSEERSVFPDASFFDGKVVASEKIVGADDFLPIFIFCFVQAKIERPSALCELLSVMCDPRKLNGEAGYYLASFHAALTHIHELDLTEAENDLSIFDS